MRDRDYYPREDLAQHRRDYRPKIVKSLPQLGETPAEAGAHARLVLDIETALAKASRTRVELRDPNANYNKFKVAAFAATNSGSAWPPYFAASGLGKLPEIIVGQPEFFTAVNKIISERPLADWKVYLRWHLLRATAPYLHRAAEQEHFAVYSTQLR